MELVTASQMQELDRRTIQEAGVPGKVLMERAGTGVVNIWEKTWGSPRGKTATIFCGKGNNGGDGFVVARLLHRKKCKVHICLLAKPGDLKGDAKTMYRRFVKLAGAGKVLSHPSEDKIHQLLNRSDFVVDAMLGTGISSSVKDEYRTAIEAINASGLPTVAVDLPSGIHTDTGAVLGAAVQAQCTVTFGYPKIGLFVGPAIDYAGQIHCVDIGIPPEYLDDMKIPATLMTKEDLKGQLPPRRPSAHKGTYGHAGIIAGSPGKTGAAAMAALGALRVGTGLVTVATPERANPSLEAKLLEAMTHPMPETKDHTLSSHALPLLQEFAAQRTSIGIGPGLSTHPETVNLIHALLSNLQTPCVIDADALNALGGHMGVLHSHKGCPILTPHPGEMARLLGNISTQNINANRLTIACEFAQHHSCVLVLKGARTIVAGPEGQASICPTGNPGMATAGMGDVLTGMITGFLAQRIPPWQAATLGIYLHGLAGDLAAQRMGQPSLLARDLLDSIPHAISAIE